MVFEDDSMVSVDSSVNNLEEDGRLRPSVQDNLDLRSRLSVPLVPLSFKMFGELLLWVSECTSGVDFRERRSVILIASCVDNLN